MCGRWRRPRKDSFACGPRIGREMECARWRAGKPCPAPQGPLRAAAVSCATIHPLHALKPLVASWAAAKDSGLWPSVAGANGL